MLNYSYFEQQKVILELITVALQHYFFLIQMFVHSEKLSETCLISSFLISSNKFPEIAQDLILDIKPGNNVLPYALDISKNTARMSFGESQSKFENVSWFVEEVCVHKNQMEKSLTNKD